jgi:hypothetical protein
VAGTTCDRAPSHNGGSTVPDAQIPSLYRLLRKPLLVVVVDQFDLNYVHPLIVYSRFS